MHEVTMRTYGKILFFFLCSNIRMSTFSLKRLQTGCTSGALLFCALTLERWNSRGSVSDRKDFVFEQIQRCSE